MTETGEAHDSEEQPRALQDAIVAYTLAAAGKRMTLDGLIATWRDWLHYSMQTPGSAEMIRWIHAVMDNMDEFLNHRSRK